MLRSVKYGLYGAVLAGLVGGTVAWTNMDKTVHLLVDGRPQTVHTLASNVGQALSEAGYHPGAHDLVAPGVSSPLKDDTTIVYKRGRLLRLDVDGTDRFVWTTASTVAQALTDLGYTTSDFTSVSRSRRLPLTATDISVRTPKHVVVKHDGVSNRITTTDATVGQLLSDMGITVGEFDLLSASVSTPLNDRERITLTRVVHRTMTKYIRLPSDTKQRADNQLSFGKTEVVQAGRPGMRQLSWSMVYVDGKLLGKAKLVPVTVRRPIDRVVKVGTKDNGTPQSIARSLLGQFGWGQDQFSCLDAMWTRESNWRTTANNPGTGAYGIPQALPGSKMASVGPNWQTDARTQITWGLGYIKSRYNSPCEAWSLWQSQGWY